MSTPDLPIDSRDWPDDPFALLGVEPGAADTEIKRAYTRLVRRFKPEHHPEQFRLIRDAYEACLERSRWHRFDPPAEVEAYPDPPSQRSRATTSHTPPADEPDVSSHPIDRLPKSVDPVEQHWVMALEGRDAEAYHGLARISETDDRVTDVTLRLYWLLSLNPALDPTRTRHHWLAAALGHSELRGTAVELYRRELESDPRGALGDPLEPSIYDQILITPAHSNDLVKVARWRFSAAGRLQWYTRILNDLTALRSALIDADEAAWLTLLVSATDWAAWGDHLEFDEFVKIEAASLGHLHLRHGPLFDRFEETDQFTKDVNRFRFNAIPVEVRNLTQILWADGDSARSSEMEAAAAAIARTHLNELVKYDGVQSGSEPYLILVGRLFERHLRMRGALDTPEFPPDQLRGLIRRLGTGMVMSYKSARPKLLELLTDHAVDPLELAAACESDPQELFRNYSVLLQRDMSLRVAWLARRLLNA